jgi:hypothetical protein
MKRQIASGAISIQKSDPRHALNAHPAWLGKFQNASPK